MNALARAIFFGKQGELRERSLKDQLQDASSLNLIINAINIWNTVYLSHAIEYLEYKGKYMMDLLPHLCPLGGNTLTFLENIPLIQVIQAPFIPSGQSEHKNNPNFSA